MAGCAALGVFRRATVTARAGPHRSAQRSAAQRARAIRTLLLDYPLSKRLRVTRGFDDIAMRILCKTAVTGRRP